MPTLAFIHIICNYWQITLFKVQRSLACLYYQPLSHIYLNGPDEAQRNIHQASYSRLSLGVTPDVISERLP